MFANMRKRAHDWGWRRAVHWQIMHLLKRTIGLHVHYVYVGSDRDDLQDAEPPPIDPEYIIKEACKEDFDPYVGKVEKLDAEFVEQAFARNDECSVALWRGELVNFAFSCRTRARVTPQIDVIVPKGFRYGYKDWTHPDHRRRHLSKMGAWFRRNKLNRPYAERSIYYIETHNYPSRLTSYRHPSLRPLRMGVVGWFDWFGRHYPFNSRRAKWIGLIFVRKDDHRVRQYG